MTFNYTLDFTNINFRKNPELYDSGRGEQGVLLVEPYKSELLPFWKFRSVELATESSKKILSLFRRYKREKDFVGMDMARKFLQMGFTRARRYANHRSGTKYVSIGKKSVLPQADDWKTNEKAKAANIFYEAYLRAKNDKAYQQMLANHKACRKVVQK